MKAKTQVRKLLKVAIAKGYVISYHDGEEWAVKQSADLSALWKEIYWTEGNWFHVEEFTLKIRKADGSVIGNIFFVPDDDGSSICDYTIGAELETLIREVE